MKSIGIGIALILFSGLIGILLMALGFIHYLPWLGLMLIPGGLLLIRGAIVLKREDAARDKVYEENFRKLTSSRN